MAEGGSDATEKGTDNARRIPTVSGKVYCAIMVPRALSGGLTSWSEKQLAPRSMFSYRTDVRFMEVAMPRISHEKIEDRRNQIREAAARCFSRKGIQATTMREIFAEAGMSAGAVYNYYRTKDELIEDGIVASTAESAEAIVEAARTMTFREIVGLFLADLEVAAMDGRARSTPMIHAEVAVRPELLKKFQAGRNKIRAAAQQQVALSRPDLSHQQHATLVDFVLAFYQGLVSEAALESLPDLEAMGEIIDLVLTQYGAKS